MSNGSLSLHIPIISYPQRGGILRLDFSVLLKNPVYTLTNTRLTPPGAPHACATYCWVWALKYGTGQNAGPASLSLNSNFPTMGEVFNCLVTPCALRNYEVVEPDGAVHQMSTTATNWISLDTTGYSYNSSSYTLTNRQGTKYVFNPSNGYPGTLASMEDANGNVITPNYSTGLASYTDTMGRVIPARGQSASSSACPTGNGLLPASAQAWNFPAPNGSSTTFTVCTAAFPLDLSYLCNGFTPSCSAPTGTNAQVQSIVLPNGTSWNFAFDTTGALSQITLPTGGTISYTWAGGYSYCFSTTSGATASQVTVNALSRTVNDASGAHTWHYVVTPTGGATGQTVQTIVTDPNGNDSVHILPAIVVSGTTTPCSFYETELDEYSGSHTNGTFLRKTITSYSTTGAWAIPYGPALAMSVVPTSTTTTDLTSGKSSQTTKSWDPGVALTGNGAGLRSLYGDLLTQSDYDFGGALLRTTTNTYMVLSGPNASLYLANNLLSLPYTTQVKDGSGNQLSLTQYNYDETARAPSNLTSANQWVSNPPSGNYRGNNTSVYRWLNSGTFTCPNGHSGGSGGYIISTKTYFDDGMLNTDDDPCGNTTTYAYNLTYWGALPTTVTNPLGQSTTNTYDFNTSLLTSTTDPNNLTTNYNIVPYDSLWRLRQVNYPDGGVATYCYTDGLPANCSAGNAGSHPFAVIVTKKINSTQTKISTAVLDGLARTSQTQLNSDPQGVVYTDTTYDALGRVSTVSNPYRTGTDATTSTGTTTYGYDALSRKTSVTYPQTGTGTSILQTAYCGPSTLVTDPTGKWRRSRVDGLGRLVEVDEPNSTTATVNSNACPGSGEAIWVTSYTNDGLGNLTNVVQNGTHQRSFTYDSLSRLLCSSNPENSSASCPAFGATLPSSGAVTYAYNPDGTVLKKTDSRSITTNYTYDALLRTTGVTYSNGDPSVTFTYDQSNCLGLSAPCHNIGHRTSMTDGAGSESWAYKVDSPNLRSIHQDRRTNGILSAKTATYYLDLAGNVTQLQYPTGRVVNYTYDAADRPSSAVDSANGITYVNGWQTPPIGTSCVAGVVCYTPQGSIYAENLRQMSTFSGINVLHTYNSRLQPSRITASSPTSWGNGLDVSYNFVDPVSNANTGVVYGITNNLNSARSQVFKYDQLNRITSANTGATTTGSYCFGYQFSYDAWGNLLSQTQDSNYSGCSQGNMGTVTEFPVGTNRLSLFSYDNAGNALNDTFYNYTWDGESQLKTANGVTYSHDGDGRRAAKVGSKYYWYGSGGEILAETDASGNLQSEYVFFGGRRTAIVPSVGSPLHYIEDMLGSSRLIAKPTLVCYDADFTPYGGERSYTNSCAQNYKFEGKERDTETLNDDFGAREYSWRFGRWLSSDWSATPIAVPYANTSNPQTLNLYSMVSDDPESFADLDGHCDTACQILKGIATGTGKFLWNNSPGGMAIGQITQAVQDMHNPAAAQAKAKAEISTLSTVLAAGAGSEKASIKLGSGIVNAWQNSTTEQKASAVTQGTLALGTAIAGGLVGSGSSGAANAQSALDSAVATRVGNPGAMIGAFDTKTGATAVGVSGEISRLGSINPQISAAAEKVGGIGAVNPGAAPVGCCAEVDAANQLTNAGSDLKNVQFTGAVRPRTGAAVPMCSNCETMFEQ